MKVLKSVKLNPSIHSRTKATRYLVNGKEVSSLPATLQIVSFEGDPGFNLIHLNENGEEITDTYHDSIDDALDQAKLDFLIEKGEWQDSL